MEKTLTIVTLFAFLFFSPMIYAGEFQSGAPNLDPGSTTPENSAQDSSPTNESDESSTVAFTVLGGVTIVVGSTILTVHALKVKKERVLRLQDQIYLADGKDYRDILNYFELGDKDLIKANDELVAAGYQIASDQDAADYLAALMLALANRSQKVQYQLSLF
jgi:hypothetical protein